MLLGDLNQEAVTPPLSVAWPRVLGRRAFRQISTACGASNKGLT
jgi:hypothetical protein